jgi:16S rRNA (guanine527-N7)-methyltransferase
VSRGDADALIERHLVDSLAALTLLFATPEDALIADVGSGAGFPGIPLAVTLAPRRFVLVEPRRKRASFLRAAGRAIGAGRVEVRECRVEDLAEGDLRNRLTAAVTRASLASDAYLGAVRPLLRDGGQAIAYRSEADAAAETSRPGFTAPEIHPYRISGGRSACLVRWRRAGEPGPEREGAGSQSP